MTRDQLLDLLRRECDAAGGLRAWSRAHGISAQYIGRILAHPDESIGPRLLEELGLERVITYRYKEPL